MKEVARPELIAKYQNEMGHVDRHNSYRQGTLKLAKTWKTKRYGNGGCFFGMSKNDAQKYKDMDDSDSIFFNS